jgi:hypothetical protein
MSRSRIFISYRRDDSSGHAGRLYDALADHFGSENVFIDVDTIRIGSDFAETIEQALAECDAVVALIGRDWTSAAFPNGERRLEDAGDFVRIELETAFSHEIPVVPVAVRGATFPEADELPDSLKPLARRHGIELRDSAWRDDVNRLIRRLAGLAQTAPSQAQPEQTTKWSRRSKVRLTVAAVAVGLVAIAIAVAATERGGTSSGGQTTSPSLAAELSAASAAYEAWQHGRLSTLTPVQLSRTARRDLESMPRGPNVVAPSKPQLSDCTGIPGNVTCVSAYHGHFNLDLHFNVLRYGNGVGVDSVDCWYSDRSKRFPGGIPACASRVSKG